MVAVPWGSVWPDPACVRNWDVPALGGWSEGQQGEARQREAVRASLASPRWVN